MGNDEYLTVSDYFTIRFTGIFVQFVLLLLVESMFTHLDLGN